LNGVIETADGSITLAAGHEVLVGGGYVRTMGGGNISITTGDGDVSSGTDAATFDYTRSATRSVRWAWAASARLTAATSRSTRAGTFSVTPPASARSAAATWT